MNMKQNGKIKENAGPVDKLISVITYIVFALFSLICIYPFYYIFINTISANDLSEKGKIIFWPHIMELVFHFVILSFRFLEDDLIIIGKS